MIRTPVIAIMLFTALHGLPVFGQAQPLPIDSAEALQEVTVNAYFSKQPLLRVTTSAAAISRSLLAKQSGITLLPALNTVPGIRMEERSPGSYRLSVRGSLLRSPFGVRNVKIYFDEIPLTDAGGNTYLNALDAGSLDGIGILKGPDGSLYGANSGGVLLLQPYGMEARENSGQFRLSSGSYGLFHEQVAANIRSSERYRFSISQAWQRSDGYRDHSGMQRHHLQTVQRFQYQPGRELRLLAFYSDLRYQTPGGLTESQYADNPKASRPPAGPNPGAADQQAGIFSKILTGGLVHDTHLSERLKHVMAVYGSYVDFRNPFITNYEKRFEHNLGVRTYLDYTREVNAAFSWRANAGLEWQQGGSRILNYDNHNGTPGAEQSGDALRNGYHFYFVRWSADLYRRLSVESALSLNYYGYGYRGLFPTWDNRFERVTFTPSWMPRLALSYLLTPSFSWRASLGKGYSPATTAEVRASDQIVNTSLRPETGWNHETGFRWQSVNRRFLADASVFYYRMRDAIVRQERPGGEEYFGNAGGLTQRGLEASFHAWLIPPRSEAFIRGLQLSSNLTLSHFRFSDYLNYSGNRLTGVPSEMVASSAYLLLPGKIGLYILHNYTSSIPLNDANTVYAGAYQLLQAKATWEIPVYRNYQLQLFAGADNLLNEHYSLGNDINAFGGRYFNAAPLRNFFAGVAIRY